MTSPSFVRQVEGWLRDALNGHGPITASNVFSAAKRLAGQFEAYLAAACRDAYERGRAEADR